MSNATAPCIWIEVLDSFSTIIQHDVTDPLILASTGASLILFGTVGAVLGGSSARPALVLAATGVGTIGAHQALNAVPWTPDCAVHMGIVGVCAAATALCAFVLLRVALFAVGFAGGMVTNFVVYEVVQPLNVVIGDVVFMDRPLLPFWTSGLVLGVGCGVAVAAQKSTHRVAATCLSCFAVATGVRICVRAAGEDLSDEAYGFGTIGLCLFALATHALRRHVRKRVPKDEGGARRDGSGA